ncbi:GntR family transcriptional regulator [Nonomuraea sp. NPDC052116]|uniref:GntR family transcriptional regulator n=1 Tax=Nonomuraea sp. NPDC052116 TaxID=3155665 RepID=UPI00341B29E8
MSPEPQTGSASRIAADLRAAIADGRFGPGAKLPTVRDLMEQYGVSRNTASKAVAQLSTEGLIRTRYGSGAYVREAHQVRRVGPHRYARSRWAVTTTEAHQDENDGGDTITRQGGQTQTVERVPADERVAAGLGVELGSEVVKRDRLMTSDGQPTHTMTSYYRPEDVEGTPIADPRPGIAGRGGGYTILTERGLEPRRMVEDLFARMPTVEEAARLKLPPGEPVVEVHRVALTAGGRVVEYAEGVHAASRFVWSFPYNIPD